MNYTPSQSLTQSLQLMQRIPGQVYLWLAVLIFGASSAVTRKLTEIGAQHFIGGENPISLCNVLFVGNLCALLVFLGLYHQQWRHLTVNALSQAEWVSLVIVAILSGALAPGLIFQALALTPVTNVVLISRLEPPLTLALSIWILRDRVSRWEIGGAIMALIGVALTILLQPAGLNQATGSVSVGLGELLAILGAIAISLSTIVSKQRLPQIPLGIYSIIRTGLGTVIFFLVALVLYGHDHFAHAFSPFLWKWMLLYGGIIIVVGQSFWLAGLRAASVATASIISSFTPIAGIMAAYAILGEVPTQAQLLGAGVILVGLVLSQIGIRRQGSRRFAKLRQHSLQAEQLIEAGMGFKGL